MNWPFPPVVGHKAFHTDPNSIQSIRYAHAAGVRCVELDLHLTSDGRAIVRHDEDVGDAKVWQHSLMTLCAGHEGENFHEACKVMSELGMSLLADLKIPHGRPETIPALVYAVMSCAWQHGVPVVMASFSPRVADYLGGAMLGGNCMKGTIITCHNGEEQPGNASGYLFHADSPMLDKRFVEATHKYQRCIGAYAVHGAGRARALLDSGVDFVVMDHPELMIT
jgi:glycerophosphoryl diester phosphodiesterase